MCCFVLGALWDQIISRYPKHQITGLILLPTQKRGGVPFTKRKNQVDGLASPTALYLPLDHKEANTRCIVSQMAAIQFLKMNMTLQYVHIEGGIFSTKGGRRGEISMG